MSCRWVPPHDYPYVFQTQVSVGATSHYATTLSVPPRAIQLPSVKRCQRVAQTVAVFNRSVPADQSRTLDDDQPGIRDAKMTYIQFAFVEICCRCLSLLTDATVGSSPAIKRSAFC